MTSQRAFWGAAALALASALLSLLGLIALNTGATLGVTPVALGFTQGYEEAAYRRLTGARGAGDLKEARSYAEAALKLSPYANTARLRLVYINTLENGHLTADGARQFAKTYDLVPIDADVAAWRVRFGLENWESLPAPVRGSVQQEALTFWRLGSRDVDMPAVLNTIHNPAGRLAVALWLHTPQAIRR